jgi:hypothetical protein
MLRNAGSPMTEAPGASARTPWDPALALMSLSAAAIHFAVTGDHAQEHVAFGLFFLGIAWAQALWAGAIVIGPRRWLFAAGIAGNAAIVVVWAASRAVGVPIGPEPWTPEAVGVADLVSTILELGIVVGCAARLARDARPEPVRHAGRAPAALAFAVVLVASAAMTTVGSHGHGTEADAGHAHDATAASGDDHADGGHHMVGGSGEPDLFQIEAIRDATRAYRDVHVALQDGWRKEHPDWPETGAHFYHPDTIDGIDGAFTIDPGDHLAQPEYLMYSKFLTGEWKLVAVAYFVDQSAFPEPPTGLTGAQYHEHVWNCIVDGEELEEEDWGVISREECEIMEGEWSPGGVWMTHVWLVDNPNGIFAEENPLLTALQI